MSPLGWVLITVVTVVVLVVGAWVIDRRDHRRHLERGAACDPDGMRATGDAWRPVVGDGPPMLQAWFSRGGAAVGPARTVDEASGPLHRSISQDRAQLRARELPGNSGTAAS